MPRATSSRTAESEASDRPVRRVATRTRTPRARVTAPTQQEDVPETPVRKAPTNQSRNTNRSRRITYGHLAVMAVLVFGGVVGSILLGHSDEGTIDVAATIAARNARIEAGQATAEELEISSEVIPVPTDNPQNLPNGGLRGRGIGSQPASASPVPPVPTATTTVDVSDGLGTSTIDMEEDPNVPSPESVPEPADPTSLPAEAVSASSDENTASSSAPAS